MAFLPEFRNRKPTNLVSLHPDIVKSMIGGLGSNRRSDVTPALVTEGAGVSFTPSLTPYPRGGT